MEHTSTQRFRRYCRSNIRRCRRCPAVCHQLDIHTTNYQSMPSAMGLDESVLFGLQTLLHLDRYHAHSVDNMCHSILLHTLSQHQTNRQRRATSRINVLCRRSFHAYPAAALGGDNPEAVPRRKIRSRSLQNEVLRPHLLQCPPYTRICFQSWDCVRAKTDNEPSVVS